MSPSCSAQPSDVSPNFRVSYATSDAALEEACTSHTDAVLRRAEMTAGGGGDGMPGDLPEYYFRIRENGAAVFRVDTENRQRRIEMEPIATVNTRSGAVRPQGDRVLADADQAHIAAWLAERQALIARRDLDDILRTVDQLNLTAHWVQSRAGDADLAVVTDALLLAMHDLRTVLVRRKAERLGGAVPE